MLIFLIFLFMCIGKHMGLSFLSTEYFKLFSLCVGVERLTGILDRDKSYGGGIRGKRNWLWSVEKSDSNLKC